MKRMTAKAITAGLILTIVPMLLPAQTPATDDTGSNLVHTVYFWFQDGVSDTDGREFYYELKKLTEIPQIKHAWIGVPAPTEGRDVIDSSYDYSITFVFDSVEDEAEYQIHPIHTEFVDNNSHLWDRVRVYDALALE